MKKYFRVIYTSLDILAITDENEYIIEWLDLSYVDYEEFKTVKEYIEWYRDNGINPMDGVKGDVVKEKVAIEDYFSSGLIQLIMIGE